MDTVDFKQRWSQPVQVGRLERAERYYTDVLTSACKERDGIPIIQACAVVGLGELYLLRHDPKSLVKAAALFNTAMELCQQEGSAGSHDESPVADVSKLLVEEEGDQHGRLRDYKRRLVARSETCANAFSLLLETWNKEAADIADMPEEQRPPVDAEGSPAESYLANQGYSLLKDDEYPKAAFLLKKALDACGEKDVELRAKYNQDLGDALRKMGDLQQAIVHFQKALRERIQLGKEENEGDVTTVQLLVLFGGCLSAGEQFDLAHAYFEAAEEMLPMYFDENDPDLGNSRKLNDLLRVAFLARQGKTDEAGKIFRNVDPTTPDLYRSLASHTYDQGLLIETIQFHETAMRFAPDNTSNQHNLACMYHVRAQHAKEAGNDDIYNKMIALAEKNFQQAISQNKKDGKPGIGLSAEYGNFLCRKGRWADAIPVLKGIVELPKSTEDASGLIYNQMEMTTLLEEIKAEVKNTKDRSLPVSQRHFAFYLLTRALKETGEDEEAEKIVSDFQADVNSGDKRLSWSLLGYSLWRTGRLQEASAAFMRAFDNERSSPADDLARQNCAACLVSANLNKPDGPTEEGANKPTDEDNFDLD